MASEIQRRSCANCANFNSHPKDGEPTCWDFTTFGANGIRREPMSSDCCDEHLTFDEDRFQTAFIEEGRQSGGLPGAHAAMQAWIDGRAFIRSLPTRGGA